MRLVFGLAVALASCAVAAQDAPQNTSTFRLTLDSTIERALANSPLLSAAEAQVRAARGLAEQSSLRLNPELGLEAENVGGSGPYRGFDGAVYTLQVSQELEVGGKRRLRHQAGNQEVEAQAYQLAVRRLALIEQVASAYIRLVATQEHLQLAQQRTELARTLLAQVQERVQAARESQIQLSQAEIALARAKLAEETLERELQHSRHVLASFWLGHHEPFQLDSSPFFELSQPVDEERLEAGLLEHPALGYWESQRERRASLLELERARALPNPRVQVGLRQFAETDDQALVIGLGMPIPVFDRNQGGRAEARAELERVASQKVQTRMELTNLGLQALEEMINAYRQAVTLSESIVPAAERAFQLAYEAYRAGRFPYLEVIEAQRTLFETKESYLAALEQYHLARVQVDYVMATHLEGDKP